jgi:acetyl-CoA carboxylase carboxyl transferase subunit beta
MLGDVNIAEPGAHIHFAGGRVVEETTRQKSAAMPTAEFMLQHGMVDLVVPRVELRPTIARLLRIYNAHSYHRAAAPATPASSQSNGARPPANVPSGVLAALGAENQ